MAGSGWWYEFSVGSTTHVAMVIAFGLTAGGIVAAARRLRGSALLPRLERIMIAVLAAIAAGAILKDLVPGSTAFHWLPLQMCDLTAVVGPIALATRWRPCRALLHYWGLTMAAQGFIFPSLETGPATAAFWWHFVGHGGIVGAALYDLLARGYRPGWADLRVAMCISAAYTVAILPLNAWSGWNYGFIGNHPHPVLDLFGPWPARVPVLIAIAFSVMTAMTLVSLSLGRLRATAAAPLAPPHPVAAPPIRRAA